MKYTTIIKKGTKDNPEYMVHHSYYDTNKVLCFTLIQEDDNLPVFQPFPEYIEKDELDKQGGELMEVELKIL